MKNPNPAVMTQVISAAIDIDGLPSVTLSDTELDVRPGSSIVKTSVR